LDESVLATGSYDGTVRLWDLKSSSYLPIETLKSFKDSVTKVICREERIYASSVDGCVRTFDIAMGEILQDNLF
jgi:mitogen-activated protein kinase organizer 1